MNEHHAARGLSAPVAIHIAAPRSDVWHAITAESHLSSLMQGDEVRGLTLEATTVGERLEWWGDRNHVGEILAVDPGRLLTWRWSPTDDKWSSVVEISLSDRGDGCDVTVKELGFPEPAETKSRVSLWLHWLDDLHWWMTFPTRTARSPRPGSVWIDALVDIEDPARVEIVARGLIQTRPSRFDLLIEAQLVALQAHAVTDQGRLDEAEAQLDEYFSGFEEAPAWIPMLDCLERGRIAKRRAVRQTERYPDRELDYLWEDAATQLAQVVWFAPWRSGYADLELALRAIYEVGTMDTTAGATAPTGQWLDLGIAIASRADQSTHLRWMPRLTAARNPRSQTAITPES